MSTPLPPPAPGCVHVASLPQARQHKRKYNALLTLQDPNIRRNDNMRIVSVHGLPGPAHLTLTFEDVDVDYLGLRVATPAQVALALEFARHHAGGSLLVHCYHGRGRSTAVAYAVLCDRLGAGREAQALQHLLHVRPEAVPNRIVVQHADQLLARGGAMVAALLAWEAAQPGMHALRMARLRQAIEHPELYARQ